MTKTQYNKLKPALNKNSILFFFICMAFFARTQDSSISVEEFKSSGKILGNTFGIHGFSFHADLDSGFTEEADSDNTVLLSDILEEDG